MGDLYCESNWVGPEEREATKRKIDLFISPVQISQQAYLIECRRE